MAEQAAAAPPEPATFEEAQLMSQFGVRFADIEPEGWQLYVAQQRAPAALARLVRLTAVNKMLAQHGMVPLTLGAAPPAETEPVPVRLATARAEAAQEAPPHARPHRRLVLHDEDRGPRDPEQVLLAQELLGLSPEQFDTIRGTHAEVCGLRVDHWTHAVVARLTPRLAGRPDAELDERLRRALTTRARTLHDRRELKRLTKAAGVEL